MKRSTDDEIMAFKGKYADWKVLPCERCKKPCGVPGTVVSVVCGRCMSRAKPRDKQGAR